MGVFCFYRSQYFKNSSHLIHSISYIKCVFRHFCILYHAKLIVYCTSEYAILKIFFFVTLNV